MSEFETVYVYIAHSSRIRLILLLGVLSVEPTLSLFSQYARVVRPSNKE